MSVDQELARAVAEAEAEAEVSAPAVAQAASPGAPDKPKNKSSLGLLIGLLVIVAGVLSLVFTSCKGFTLASGGKSKDYAITKRLMYREPAVWHALMEKLSEVTRRYLLAQIEAGAQAVHLVHAQPAIG